MKKTLVSSLMAATVVLSGFGAMSTSANAPENQIVEASYMELNSDNATYLDSIDSTYKNVGHLKFTGELHALAVETIHNIKNLRVLDLSEASDSFINGKEVARSLSFLEGLEQLEVLILGNVNYTDFEYLSELKNLTTLTISNVESFNDLDVLKPLTNLENLTITYTSIDDLTPLKEMKGLEKLSIAGDYTQDFSAISSLVYLEELSIADYASVENLDLTQQKQLRSLELLNVIGPLSIASEAGIQDLQQLKKLVLDDAFSSNKEKLVHGHVLLLSQLKTQNLKTINFNISDDNIIEAVHLKAAEYQYDLSDLKRLKAVY